MTALQRRYGPSLLVHWEDVAAPNAFALLQALQAQGVPTFNDDIHCTAVVTLAAVFGALRLPGVLPLEQQRFLFFGAGQVRGLRWHLHDCCQLQLGADAQLLGVLVLSVMLPVPCCCWPSIAPC